MPRIVDAKHDAPAATGADEGAGGAPEASISGQATGAPLPRPRIALAHDWLCGMRGGERVLERIACVAAEVGEVSALYVMFDNGRPHAPGIDGLAKRVSRLGRLPGALRVRRWLLPLYPVAVADVSRQLARDHAEAPIDLLISSSSAAIKGLRAPGGVPHICYCHSPARYIWSRTAEYGAGGGGLTGLLRGLGLRVVRPFWRWWDRRSALRVTTFIANSCHIAAEIERCYRREAQVIHPPVRGKFLPAAPGAQGGVGQDCILPATAPQHGGAACKGSKPAAPVSSGRARKSGKRQQGQKGSATAAAAPELALGAPSPRRERFWLVVSALEPYKRVDLAIRAARLTGAHLVVAGDGSCRGRLERRGGPLIRFEGRVSDERLRELYQTAAVLLFPQIEDFGIVCVEAQACGLPVAAAGAGGALDIIIDGQTGALATPGDVRSLAEAARRASAMSPEACRANAARFSEERFDAELRGAMEGALPHCSAREAGPASVEVEDGGARG